MSNAVNFLLFAGIDDYQDKRYGFKRKLFNPPIRTLGPSKVANKVREAGYTCQIIDFFTFFSEEEITLALEKYVDAKTVIGISTTFFLMSNDSSSQKLKRAIQRCRKKLRTKLVLGGPLAYRFKNFFNADHVITGFAENEIVPLLNNMINHGLSKRKSDFWDIQTCKHRWHESDRIQTGEALPLEIGRGCIFKCKFCRFEMLGKKKGSYLRNIDNIYDELIHNYKHFQTTHYVLVEDTFNDDQTKLDCWFDMVKSLPFQIKYVSYLRADLLHRFPETSYKLLESGFIGAALGIETLNPIAAKAIGKTWSAKHGPTYLPKLVYDVWQNKVLTRINWIVGLPGEDKKSLLKTKQWITDNKLFNGVFSPLLLGINNQDKENVNINISIFDKEYDKYGYKIIGEIDKYTFTWENQHMNYFDARDIAHELNQHFENVAPIGNFRGIALNAIGVPLDYLIKTATQHYDEDVNLKIKTFVDNYKTKILE